MSKSKYLTSQVPAGKQYSGDIRWVFSQRCYFPDNQWTFREHVKAKHTLCVYQSAWFDDQNVDPLVNFSNHKVMFPEYSKNIPQISVSEIFQGDPGNITRLWKYFYEVKMFKKCFVGCSVKILILAVSSLAMFFWIAFHLG